MGLIADAFVEYTFEEKGTIKFIPEGIFEILFHPETEIFHQSKNGKGWTKRPIGFIGGLHTEAYDVKVEKNHIQCFGLKLKPEKAKFLFSEHLSSFKNNVVGLDEIWGNSGFELMEKIAAEKSILVKEILLEKFILKKIKTYEPKLNTSFCQIIKENSAISVKQLAQLSFKSDSHFRKLFREEIGLSPKEYIKVIRTQKAIQHLKSKNNTSLTDLAYELGYYDQSHFIHEFQSITKSSPTSFLQAL